MTKEFFLKSMAIAGVLFSAVFASTYSEISRAQSVRLEVVKSQAAGAPRGSLDPGEKLVVLANDQKKMDVEFNSRRLLRFHQLWNLYLFRNEAAARTLQAQVDAMVEEDSRPATEAELALADAEKREPKQIAVTLRLETSKARSDLRSKNELNETARKESDATRLTKVHAGLPPDQVSQFIEENSKVLAKRLRAEMAAGGENGEKAKVNLAYLQETLLPHLRDPQYFSVSRNAFDREFDKVVGKSGTATGR
jgi:hypothetical protein